jgi:hypothetical protein
VETRVVAAEQAVYRLMSSDRSAADRFVEIGYGRERRIVSLEGELAAIDRAFTALVRGEVTPCTMPDVLEDLAAAE